MAAMTTPGLDGGPPLRRLRAVVRDGLRQEDRRRHGPQAARDVDPYPAAFAAGAVLEALTAPLRGDPPLTRARVRTLTQDRLYRIGEAERRLGWRPNTTLENGLPQTIGWYRARNLLAP
jgi:nucleoside-diphosphate-sugar epimerase